MEAYVKAEKDKIKTEKTAKDKLARMLGEQTGQQLSYDIHANFSNILSTELIRKKIMEILNLPTGLPYIKKEEIYIENVKRLIQSRPLGICQQDEQQSHQNSLCEKFLSPFVSYGQPKKNSSPSGAFDSVSCVL